MDTTVFSKMIGLPLAAVDAAAEELTRRARNSDLLFVRSQLSLGSVRYTSQQDEIAFFAIDIIAYHVSITYIAVSINSDLKDLLGSRWDILAEHAASIGTRLSSICSHTEQRVREYSAREAEMSASLIEMSKSVSTIPLDIQGTVLGKMRESSPAIAELFLSVLDDMREMEDEAPPAQTKKAGRTMKHYNRWAFQQFDQGKTVEESLPEYIRRSRKKPPLARELLRKAYQRWRANQTERRPE